MARHTELKMTAAGVAAYLIGVEAVIMMLGRGVFENYGYSILPEHAIWLALGTAVYVAIFEGVNVLSKSEVQEQYGSSLDIIDGLSMLFGPVMVVFHYFSPEFRDLLLSFHAYGPDVAVGGTFVFSLVVLTLGKLDRSD